MGPLHGCPGPRIVVIVVQSSSHVQLCDPIGCSTPGLPVPHHLLESAQVHVHYELAIPSNHLILCCLLLRNILPQIPAQFPPLHSGLTQTPLPVPCLWHLVIPTPLLSLHFSSKPLPLQHSIICLFSFSCIGVRFHSSKDFLKALCPQQLDLCQGDSDAQRIFITSRHLLF